MATGVTGTAICTALNKSILETWLFGVDSYQSPKIVEQQLEQAYRWSRRSYRNFPSPEKHVNTPLATAFHPGPCGMCPVCALKTPVTARACECKAPQEWTTGYRAALVSDTHSQRASRAAAIAAAVRNQYGLGASLAWGREGFTDALNRSGTAVANSMEWVSEASGLCRPTNLSAASDPATDTIQSGDSIQLNIIKHIPNSAGIPDLQGSSQQQAPHSSQQGSAQLSIVPIQQLHPTPTAAPKHQHRSSPIQPGFFQQLPVSISHSGPAQQPAVTVQQLHLDSLQQQSESISNPGPAHWPAGTIHSSQQLQSLPQQDTTPPCVVQHSGSNPGHLHQQANAGLVTYVPSAATIDHSTIALLPTQASAGASNATTNMTITSALGQYSVAWPLTPRFVYIVSDGNFKLTHYRNTGTEHTAAVNALDHAVAFGQYFSPSAAFMYNFVNSVRERNNAATAAASAPGPAELADLDASHLSSAFEPTCQAELLAARSHPPKHKTANTDVKVVVGCVCPHVVSPSDHHP